MKFFGQIQCLLVLIGSFCGSVSSTCLGVSNCDCEVSPDGSSTIINCRNKGLTSVPTFTYSSLQYSELTLALNNITTIPDSAFNGLHFDTLDLTSNPVKTISSTAFTGIENDLKELILQLDPVASFPINSLIGLTKLEKLTILGFGQSTLPNNAINNLNSLMELHITQGKLSTLSSSAFVGPLNLNTISLDDNYFSQVPTTALANVPGLTTLSLVRNKITSISANAFQGITGVVSLDLTGNGLSGNIDANAFTGLKNTLKILILVSCQLTDSSLNAVKQIQSLTELQLQLNSLVNLPSNLLNSNLHKLNLAYNRISSITKDIFQNVVNSLIVLHLEQNAPSTISIPVDAFSNLIMLQELYLDGISSLQLGTISFAKMKNSLSTLSLKQTNIGATVWDAIGPIARLQLLYLSSTSLSTIPDYAFRSNNRLQVLDLSSNSISSITPTSLYGLKSSLATLNLNSNRISTLDHCLFYQFTSIDYSKLGLTNNPLQCDCQLKWLFLASKQTINSLIYPTIQWKCSSGKLFVQMNISTDFQCPQADPPCSAVPTPSPTSNPVQQTPLTMSIQKVSPDSITIQWSVDGAQSIFRFIVSYQIINSNVSVSSEDSGNVREFTITNLQPSTAYNICINMFASPDWVLPNQVCSNTTTSPPPGTSLLAPILGGVLGGVGGLAIIVGIVVLAYCIAKKRSKQDSTKASGNGSVVASRSDMPRVGYDSKRYLKNRSSGATAASFTAVQRPNDSFEQTPSRPRLESFTNEEKDKILTMLAAVRASTSSAVSDGRTSVDNPYASKHRSAQKNTDSGSANFPKYGQEPRRRGPSSSDDGSYQQDPEKLGQRNLAYRPDELDSAAKNAYEKIPGDPDNESYIEPFESSV